MHHQAALVLVTCDDSSAAAVPDRADRAGKSRYIRYQLHKLRSSPVPEEASTGARPAARPFLAALKPSNCRYDGFSALSACFATNSTAAVTSKVCHLNESSRPLGTYQSMFRRGQDRRCAGQAPVWCQGCSWACWEGYQVKQSRAAFAKAILCQRLAGLQHLQISTKSACYPFAG